MLADRFDNSGAPYSAHVEERRQATDPIGSVTDALSPDARADVPRIPGAPIAGTAPLVSVRPPGTDSQRSFAAAATAFAGARGQDALQKYPQIAHFLAATGQSPTATLASSKLDAWRYAWRTHITMTMLVVEFREIGQRMIAAQPDDSSLAPDGGSHAVHFYEDDDELSARVAAFIGEALLAGDPAVIIASPPHRQQFIARLGP